MAETSWPFPDPANSSKRIVTDVQYEIGFHPLGSDGLLGHPDDPPLIYADDSGMQVKVRGDRKAVLRGHGWSTDVLGKTLTIASNASGSTRIDLVVLRLTRSTWQVTAEVRQGTPGSPAPSPVTDVGTTGVYEIVLAEVSVRSGDASIGTAQVTPRAWYVGDDGQYLCKDSGTRPPHAPGREVWETDSARKLISNGTAWRVISDDSGVTSVSMAGGFVANINRLQRRSGGAILTLSVRRPGSAIPAGSTVKVATLPAGFAPTFDVQVAANYSASGGDCVTLQVTTAGNVNVITPSGLGVNADRVVAATLPWFVS